MDVDRVRSAHLRQDLIQPLERTVQVNFDPAGGGSHHLPSVFYPPALDKTDSYRTHPRQLKHLLKSLMD